MMIKVGDVYESDVAIYKVVGETRCKWRIQRVNKSNHPVPNKEFMPCLVWKNCFSVKNLRLIEG